MKFTFYLLITFCNIQIGFAKGPEGKIDCDKAKSEKNCDPFFPRQVLQMIECLDYDSSESPMTALNKTEPMIVKVEADILSVDSLKEDTKTLQIRRSLTRTWTDFRIQACSKTEVIDVGRVEVMTFFWQPMPRMESEVSSIAKPIAPFSPEDGANYHASFNFVRLSFKYLINLPTYALIELGTFFYVDPNTFFFLFSGNWTD